MAKPAELTGRAEWLRGLHVPGRPIVLPNVWDAASARAVADAGFAAVATSSGAMAASLGHADHEAAPVHEMFAAVARIGRVVDVPVTADLEAGYGLDAPDLVARMLDAGVVGCNIEDTDHPAGSRTDPDAQAEYLAAIRTAADDAGVPVVLNARVDSWVPVLGRVNAAQADPAAERERFDDAVRRAALYVNAGADCVYPIGLADPATIERFVAAVHAPVNVLAPPSPDAVPALARLGVGRVSFGTRLFRDQMEAFQRALGRLPAPPA